MSFQAWCYPHGFAELPAEWVPEIEDQENGTGEAEASSGIRVPALTPDGVARLLSALREEGRSARSRMSVDRVIQVVDRISRRFRDPVDPLRWEALAAMQAQAGYSPQMATRVLDGMCRDWSRGRLETLLHAEFPDPGVLDGFRPGPAGSRVRAQGYPLVFHLGAGSVPGVTATSLIRALLVGSASLVKPGRGDLALPVLLARAIKNADPELGRCLAVAYWPASREDLTEGALQEADLVVVYGGDETLARVRGGVRSTTVVRAYRHRLGVAVVGREALSGSVGSSASARAAAEAVAIFDQRGCVSPHVILVEEGGEVSAEEWARELAGALEALEGTLPSGDLSQAEGVALQQSRGSAEIEESMGRGWVLHGGEEAAWTVHFLPGSGLEPSCLNRMVRVIPIHGVEEMPRILAPWAPHLQTVGVAGLGEERGDLLEALSGLGVSRITSLEGVPWPPAWWHHDGHGPLQALVRWTDVET